MSGFTTDDVRAGVQVLVDADVRRGVEVPDGFEMIVSASMSGWISAVAEPISRFNQLLREFAEAVIAATRGPMAPSRKRPRRVARKIAARGGRLHYPMRFR